MLKALKITFYKKRSIIEKKSNFYQKKGIVNEKQFFTIGGHQGAKNQAHDGIKA